MKQRKYLEMTAEIIDAHPAMIVLGDDKVLLARTPEGVRDDLTARPLRMDPLINSTNGSLPFLMDGIPGREIVARLLLNNALIDKQATVRVWT